MCGWSGGWSLADVGPRVTIDRNHFCLEDVVMAKKKAAKKAPKKAAKKKAKKASKKAPVSKKA